MSDPDLDRSARRLLACIYVFLVVYSLVIFVGIAIDLL